MKYAWGMMWGVQPTDKSTFNDKTPFIPIVTGYSLYINDFGGNPDGPAVRSFTSTAGGRVQSLVGELRSHKSRGMARNIKNDNKWFLTPKQGEIPTFPNKFLIFYQDFPIRVINKYFWLKDTALKIKVLLANARNFVSLKASLMCLYHFHFQVLKM